MFSIILSTFLGDITEIIPYPLEKNCLLLLCMCKYVKEQKRDAPAAVAAWSDF